MRLRLEFNSPGKLPFDSGDTLVPALKDAYIGFKISGQDLVTGIISMGLFPHLKEEKGRLVC